MASRHEHIYQKAQEWLIWLNTRRFLGEAPQKNILVAMMERDKEKKPPPDALMSAEIAAFNLAVSALDYEHLLPFCAVYCDYRPKPIKTLANEIGIARDTFYERAHETALKVNRTAIQLEVLNAQMQREVADYVD